MSSLLDNVTNAQKEAITYIEGPLLVIAGAGSGKTLVITRRIAYLLEQGINPYSILAITFTNKAANEIKERVCQFCNISGMWVSTFHSMCTRLLRMEIERLGYSKAFTIYDKQDQLNCIKAVMKELEIDSTRWQPYAIGNAISNAKNNLLSAAQFSEGALGYFNKIVSGVYKRYETVLEGNNALDFDDLLVKTVELFRKYPDVLERYQDKFRFILIDEYQDTNRPQYIIARLLSQRYMNVCATGDPDQSIYSWRGADIRNILDFEKDFPNTRIVRLEQNYRSTKNIILAASEVIKNNTMRKARGLWTENPIGNKIKIIYAEDEKHEARVIAEESFRFIKDNGLTYHDIAVFYRTNAQSRAIEAALRDKGIPYRIVGAVEFYQRKEVKDILAYLKLCVNPDDRIALERIINLPPRGIGKATFEKVRNWADENDLNLVAALFYLTDTPLPETFGAAGLQYRFCMPSSRRQAGLPLHPPTAGLADCMQTGRLQQGVDILKGKSKRAIKMLVDILASLITMRIKNYPVKEIIQKAIDLTGYREFLALLKDHETVDRIENIEELVNAANEYDISRDKKGDVAEFLENAALVSDTDNLDNQTKAVTLMTLHSAKGLEFPVVFLAGVEEGLLPHSQTKDDPFALEEERRLCYVGITRAKRELILTYVCTRSRYGQIIPCCRSRFLAEIPVDVTEVIDLTQDKDHDYIKYEWDTFLESRQETIDRRQQTDYIRDISSVSSKATCNKEGDFSPGEAIWHPIFGVGRILKVSGSGMDVRVNVKFNTAGTKLLMARHANLERLAKA